MAQFLGFGNGQDGPAILTGTDAPIDSSAVGTINTNSLTATNASFAAGQIILIHYTRGTNAGVYELNQIASYVAGTITTVSPLSYSYVSSGNDCSQVLVMKQYSSVDTTGTFLAKAWNGTVGGILSFLCSGKVTGSFSATGKGFRGGSANTVDHGSGYQGEGTAGPGALGVNAANGNGAGAPTGNTPAGQQPAGSGGAYAVNADDATTAQGGDAVGIADLTLLFFGGAGSGGAQNQNGGSQRGGNGGPGGGIILIIASIIAATLIENNGGDGLSTDLGNSCGGGGSGAGGSTRLVARTLTLGSSVITSIAGIPGVGGAFATSGTIGRIRVESCSLTGTTNPTYSAPTVSSTYCSIGGQIF